MLEVKQNRTNQAQEEITRGFGQASELVNTSSEQATHLGNLVDAADGSYSGRFEEVSNNIETATEGLSILTWATC